MFSSKLIAWNEEKNQRLQRERGLSFEKIVAAIQNGNLLEEGAHPKYPNQRLFEVEIEGYVVKVPYVEDETKIFLKTAFHSRKAMKKHKEKNNEKIPTG